MFFDDGASPPKEIISQWRDVVLSTFDPSTKPDDDDMPCIAVHCIAGLGRYDLSTFSTLFRGKPSVKIAPLVFVAIFNTIKTSLSFTASYSPYFVLNHCNTVCFLKSTCPRCNCNGGTWNGCHHCRHSNS